MAPRREGLRPIKEKQEKQLPPTNAEKCKTYRERLKGDLFRLHTAKAKKKLLNQHYLLSLTEEQKAVARKKARLRQQERRKRLKQQSSKDKTPEKGKLKKTQQTPNRPTRQQALKARLSQQKISTQAFVELVRDRPLLWQKSHPEFQNRDLRMALLTEIGEIAGTSAMECAKKLKGLKDTMRSQVAKLPKTPSGTPNFSSTVRISWPYFKLLLFMKDEFTVKRNRFSDEEGSDNLNNGEGLVKDEVEEEEVSDITITLPSEDNDNLSNHMRLSPSPTSWNDSFDPAFYSAERPSTTTSTKRVYCTRESEKDEAKRRRFVTEDEYDAFAADIANDLRKIDDPIKLMQTKAAIRRTVEEAVLSELHLIFAEKS